MCLFSPNLESTLPISKLRECRLFLVTLSYKCYAKLPVLQPVMNAQTADYFQPGFTHDESLVLLAESRGVTISERTLAGANLLRSGFERAISFQVTRK